MTDMEQDEVRDALEVMGSEGTAWDLERLAATLSEDAKKEIDNLYERLHPGHEDELQLLRQIKDKALEYERKVGAKRKAEEMLGFAAREQRWVGEALFSLLEGVQE